MRSTEEIIEKPIEIIIEEEDTSTPAAEMTTSKNTLFSKEIFLQKLIDGGIKQNLIPLLRTADIDFLNEIITIKTTSFAESRCRENAYWRIIESTANEL